MSQNEKDEDRLILVKGTTSTTGLAKCIYAVATKEKRTEVKVRGVGASAINQMAKACAIATGNLKSKGIGLTLFPSFQDIESKADVNKPMSAIVFNITFTS